MPEPTRQRFFTKTSPSLLPPAPSASPSRPDKRISGVAQGATTAFIRRNLFSTVWAKDSAPERINISDKQADRQVSRAKDTSDKQTFRVNKRPGQMPEQKCTQSASAATTAPQHRSTAAPHGYETGSASKAEPVIGKAPKGLRLRIIPGMRAEYPQRRPNRPRRPHWAPWHASAGSCPDLPSAPRSATRGRPSARPIRRPNRSTG